MVAGSEVLDRIVPITGATMLHRLEENIGAIDIGLTDANLSSINQAASQLPVVGDRYPEHLEKMTGL